MRRQQGFSLIEVMVTMVVVSIGLLGIAGIIVTNMKNTHSAHARSQATVLVNDIVDRMRANRALAEASPSPYAIAMNGAVCSTGVACDDLDQWQKALKNGLPAGAGSVSYDAGTRKVTVTVQWDDRRAKGDGSKVGLEAQQFSLETRL